jgi:lysophospholipase L1-like esterase
LTIALQAIVGLNAVYSHRSGEHSRQSSAAYQRVELADEPVALPNAAFIGDSYAGGAGASQWSKRWTSLLVQKMGWVEHNFARGGTGYVATSSQGPNYLGMVDEVAAASNPDIVVVSGGQNDMAELFKDRDSVSRAVTETFVELRSRLPNVRIIAVGPSVPVQYTATIVPIELDVQSAAHAVGGQYVSLLAPTPVLTPDMFIADRWHVNDAGHAAIANRIVSALAQA